MWVLVPLWKHWPFYKNSFRRLHPCERTNESIGLKIHTPDYTKNKNLKFNLRHAAFGFVFDLKVIAFGEIKHTGDYIGRKHLELVVIEQNLIIVALPGKRNFVFGAGRAS